MRLADENDFPPPDVLSAIHQRFSEIGLSDLDAIGYVLEPVLHYEMILVVDRRHSMTLDPSGDKARVSLYGYDSPEPLIPGDFE